MKKVLLALLASTSIASAADLPLLKAAPAAGYPSGRGCYAGLGAAAEVSRATTNAGVIDTTGLYAADAAIDVAFGCQFNMIGTWAALEADITKTNIGTWGFSQGVLVGFPWTNVINFLPNISSWFGGNPSVPLPGGVTSTTSKPYLGAWLHEDDDSVLVGLGRGRAWLITPSIGLGAIHNVDCPACTTGRLVLDTRLEVEFNDSSLHIGPALPLDKTTTLLTKAIFKY